MPAHDPRTTLDRRVDAFNVHDAAGLAAMHTDDGVLSSPMFGQKHGRGAIEASYRSLFTVFPDFRLDADPPIVDGDRIAQAFAFKATHHGEFMGLAGTGRSFEVHGVFLMKFRDGLIAEERRIYDFTGLLTRIGVLRTKPGF